MKTSRRKRREPYTKCGKLGDFIFQRNRYGQISYPWHAPRNPRSARQQFVRKMFGITSIGWKLLTEAERLAWHLRAKSKKTRRRLGKDWPLPPFNYYMRENVSLVLRGKLPLSRPPVEDRNPRLELPLLTRTLSPTELEGLTASAKIPTRTPGPAPPPTG